MINYLRTTSVLNNFELKIVNYYLHQNYLRVLVFF